MSKHKSNSPKTIKTNKATNLPAFEKLENRQLRSATPLNYNGQYIEYTSTGVRIELDLAHSKTSLTSYTGDLKSGGVDYKLTATEKNNTLAGSIKLSSSKSVAFTASLKNRALSLKENGYTDVFTQRAVALSNHSSGLFTYDAPSGWTAKTSTAGIIVTSADKTESTGITTGIAWGYVAPNTLVQSAKAGGSKVVYDSGTKTYYLGNGVYLSDETVAITYKVGTTTFGTGAVIGTIYNAYYNTSMVMMETITAPAAKFASVSRELNDVLTSIHLKPGYGQTASAAVASAGQAMSPALGYDDYYYDWSSWYGYQPTMTSGFYDPGVEGNWAAGYDTTWSSPYVAAEQESMAYSSTVSDASNDAFDAYIRS